MTSPHPARNYVIGAVAVGVALFGFLIIASLAFRFFGHDYGPEVAAQLEQLQQELEYREQLVQLAEAAVARSKQPLSPAELEANYRELAWLQGELEASEVRRQALSGSLDAEFARQHAAEPSAQNNSSSRWRPPPVIIRRKAVERTSLKR